MKRIIKIIDSPFEAQLLPAEKLQMFEWIKKKDKLNRSHPINFYLLRFFKKKKTLFQCDKSVIITCPYKETCIYAYEKDRDRCIGKKNYYYPIIDYRKQFKDKIHVLPSLTFNKLSRLTVCVTWGEKRETKCDRNEEIVSKVRNWHSSHRWKGVGKLNKGRQW